MCNIDEDLRLIIRDKVSENLLDYVIPIVNCILDSGCKWYSDDDLSASQIVECIHARIDYSDYTSDEFEYLLRWILYLCGIKYAYSMGLLKEDNDGHIYIPKDWVKKAGLE